MKKVTIGFVLTMMLLLVMAAGASAFWGNDKFEKLKPENGVLKIALQDINDGNAHYFKARSDDGLWVYFFTLKSRDGVIRAAIDACDVCYRAGKGYVQSGDYMVCENCGQRFLSSRINVVKGGCNPAPLNRTVSDTHLVIQMADINQNAWYNQYKKQ